MNRIVTIIGLSFAIFFLVGLATTLTRSMMIGFFDVLPVYILMGIAIVMMIYEYFSQKKPSEGVLRFSMIFGLVLLLSLLLFTAFNDISRLVLFFKF